MQSLVAEEAPGLARTLRRLAAETLLVFRDKETDVRRYGVAIAPATGSLETSGGVPTPHLLLVCEPTRIPDSEPKIG